MPDVTRPTSGKGWRYKPANTSRDLAPEARAVGRKAMDAFLVSPQMQKPTDEAAADVADAARTLAGIIAYDTGSYSESFESGPAAPVEVAGNVRVSARVTNDDDAAPAVEFGNSKVGPGKRVLLSAAQPWHTEKRPL